MGLIEARICPIAKCSCLVWRNGNGNDEDARRIQGGGGASGRAGRLNTRSKPLCTRKLIQKSKQAEWWSPLSYAGCATETRHRKERPKPILTQPSN